MKKVIFRRSAARLLLLAVLFSFSTITFAQDQDDDKESGLTEDIPGVSEDAAEAAPPADGDVAAGKALFNSQCAACHKLDNNSIGPPLRGISERRDQEWLHQWISNSQEMIAAGDPTAVALYEEYNQTAMPPFPGLSEDDIDNILAYLDQPKSAPPAEADVPGAAAATDGGVSNNIILGILAFVLIMLLVILYLVNKTLRSFAVASGVELPVSKNPHRKPIHKAFVENQFLVLVTSVIVLLGAGYFVYGFFMQVGVDQGYQPVQPIHFSHEIHAGQNQIDCKFCHASSRVSKTAGIPSLNVCMNCHKTIGEVAEETGTDEYSKAFYDGEIAKLYDAVGWDPADQAYTGDTEPVKWIRIHNLPDFAYFNHSQHVSVAGIACQECHGPVEEMEVAYQYSPLTMGWCIDCHRETNVNIQGNDYYDKIHEELSRKYGVEELTVAELGGTECAKCHY